MILHEEYSELFCYKFTLVSFKLMYSLHTLIQMFIQKCTILGSVQTPGEHIVSGAVLELDLHPDRFLSASGTGKRSQGAKSGELRCYCNLEQAVIYPHIAPMFSVRF